MGHGEFVKGNMEACMKTVKEAIGFISLFGDMTSFVNFVRFIAVASQKGFKVIPYDRLQSLNGKRDKKELGATVFGIFKNKRTGRMMEVACNPVLKLQTK